jgi:adenylosuccinate lyase
MGAGTYCHLGPNAAAAAGLLMSLTLAETFLRNAREQHAQKDINASLLKALSELAQEVKRLDDELRRARRDIQMSLRF